MHIYMNIYICVCVYIYTYIPGCARLKTYTHIWTGGCKTQNGGNPGTVTIPQYRFNKTKQHTYLDASLRVLECTSRKLDQQYITFKKADVFFCLLWMSWTAYTLCAQDGIFVLSSDSAEHSFFVFFVLQVWNPTNLNHSGPTRLSQTIVQRWLCDPCVPAKPLLAIEPRCVFFALITEDGSEHLENDIIGATFLGSAISAMGLWNIQKFPQMCILLWEYYSWEFQNLIMGIPKMRGSILYFTLANPGNSRCHNTLQPAPLAGARGGTGL